MARKKVLVELEIDTEFGNDSLERIVDAALDLLAKSGTVSDLEIRIYNA